MSLEPAAEYGSAAGNLLKRRGHTMTRRVRPSPAFCGLWRPVLVKPNPLVEQGIPRRPPALPGGAGADPSSLRGAGSRRAGFTEVECGALQVSPGQRGASAWFSRPNGAARTARGGRSTSTPRRSSRPRSCWRRARRKIFDYARVYRNGEAGPLHSSEFTMLEWYRAGEPYGAGHGRLRGAVPPGHRGDGARGAGMAWSRSAIPPRRPNV